MSLNYLFTLQECKDYLSIGDHDYVVSPEYDNVIDQKRNAAFRRIASYLDYDFLSKEHTETYNGSGNKELYLNNRPITSVSSVVIDDADVTDQVAFENSYLYMTSIFPKGWRNIEVVYTAGYTSTSMPADIKDVAYSLFLLYMKETSSLGIQNKSSAETSVSFDKEEEQRLLDRLHHYRKYIW